LVLGLRLRKKEKKIDRSRTKNGLHAWPVEQLRRKGHEEEWKGGVLPNVYEKRSGSTAESHPANAATVLLFFVGAEKGEEKSRPRSSVYRQTFRCLMGERKKGRGGKRSIKKREPSSIHYITQINEGRQAMESVIPATTFGEREKNSN